MDCIEYICLLLMLYHVIYTHFLASLYWIESAERVVWGAQEASLSIYTAVCT